MRIAIFTETFLPSADGISDTLCHLLQHLAVRGHASLLFSPGGGPRRYAETPVVGLRRGSAPMLHELTLAPPHANVRTHLRAFRPDIVHVVNPTALGIVGLKEARALGAPVVASYHLDLPPSPGRCGGSGIWRLRGSHLKWVHEHADLTLCPSRAAKSELDREGLGRLEVWSSGIDASLFSPERASPAWRRRLTDNHPEAPLVTFVGRLSPESQVGWLFEMVEALPSIRLAIVGDGPARGSLERLFDGKPVVFTGDLVGQDLSCAYASSDVFVRPADDESLATRALEAMAAGLPVVAPRGSGAEQHVLDGRNGLLFEPGDRGSISSRVRRLILDVRLADEMGRAGRAMAEEHSWAQVLDWLLGEYWNLLGRERPGTIPLLIPGRRSLARDVSRPGE